MVPKIWDYTSNSTGIYWVLFMSKALKLVQSQIRFQSLWGFINSWQSPPRASTIHMPVFPPLALCALDADSAVAPLHRKAYTCSRTKEPFFPFSPFPSHTLTVKGRKRGIRRSEGRKKEGNGWKDLLAQQETDVWVAAMPGIFPNSSYQFEVGFLLKRQKKYFLILSYLRTMEKLICCF